MFAREAYALHVVELFYVFEQWLGVFGNSIGVHRFSAPDFEIESGFPNSTRILQSITMNVRFFAFLFTLTLIAGSTGLIEANASVVLTTDFEGTTENGTSLDGVVYSSQTGAVVDSAATNLSVQNTNQAAGSGNLFTTGAAVGVFAVANNTGNGGEWNFQIDFTTGGSLLNLSDFTFDWLNFNGTGGNQNAIRNTEITFDILDSSGVSVLGGPFVQNTANLNTRDLGVQTDSISLIGSSLAANTTFTLFLQAGDATTGGNNFGFEAITLNSVEATAVPEPSSVAFLCMIGLVGLKRRRQKI